jgi:hypothetical protein
VVWEDLDARLVLAHADPEARGHLGDAIDAGPTGLYALQAPPGGFPELTARHAGELLDRPVAFTVLTIEFDGKDFAVKKDARSLPARRSRLMEPLEVPEVQSLG